MMYVGVWRTSLRRVLSTTSIPTLGQAARPLPRSHLALSPPVYLCVLLLLTSALLVPVVSQVLPSDFYPFGGQAGDSTTDHSDDGGSGKIDLWEPFPFFGKHHDKLFVNNNGVITFLKELKTYRPADFPLDETPLIAPYWADVDVQIGGTVWYRQTQDPLILQRADTDVHSYSSIYKRFHATWAFVTTWDQVGFYGAADEGKNKRNTFQCVLISDGTKSFVVINYARIEWTTGSNSRGTPETGLGGNPAQAGFNAGDGINYYEIEGAGTDSVINLTLTSNVCIPGRWIFRVDSKQFIGDWGGLVLTPSSGSMLGGYEVAITGPCFDRGFSNSSSVQGFIVEANRTFPCADVTEVATRTVYCVMPTVFRVGVVNVSVIVNDQQWNYTGRFVFVNVGLVDAKVTRHSPERWTVDQGTVSVSWKSSLFPSDEQATVEVMAYKEINREPRLVAENTKTITSANGGDKVQLRLPPLANTTLAVIRVKVPHPLIDGAYLSHWSDVFPVRWKRPTISREWCSNWLHQEQFLSQLFQQAACPCTLRQAESDTGRWQRDPLCLSQSSQLYNCIYRGTNTHECIVPNYRGSQTINQRCCYGDDGELLDVRDGGGGSMLERYHFRSGSNEDGGLVPWFSYLSEDVATFLHCCQYSNNQSMCEAFRAVRPLSSCQGYSPPAAAQAAGDPHIVTLDGVNYTFNGEGDFVLLQDVTETIRVHVRADRAVDIDGQEGNATLFTAVAMSVVNETDVVEIHKDTDDTVTVLVNQQEVELTSTHSQLRGMTIYRNMTSNNTVEYTVVMDTVGISVLVAATPDLLNVMVLVGSSTLRGNLTGLLGNYNGEKEDDFKPRYGEPIAINSSMSEVHYLFGMTWFLDSNETLLYHPETSFQVEVAESETERHFVPQFMGTVEEEKLRNGTEELCQGNLQCMFDFQLTGKESIGQSTKQFSDYFEIKKRELAAVVRCPYVQHITNGNRTVEGQAVGDKVHFICDNDRRPINGSTTLMCLQSGSWNSSAPDCVKKVPITPQTMEKVLLFISVGSAAGGFVFVVSAILILRCAILKCRHKYEPKPSTDTVSEGDQGIALPTIFPPSEAPNPVFENPVFLTSLQKLRSEDGGKFQIPRPRYVDPNIYTEYF